jgi:uncharacterized Zn-finger protein
LIRERPNFTLTFRFSTLSRMHGRKNKCLYGCHEVQFVSTLEYLKHIREVHPTKVTDRAGLAVRQQGVVEQNTKTKFPRMYECDKCGAEIVNKCALKSHVESHLPFENREKFVCELCLKIFTRLKSLRAHLQTVHENKILRYECSKCRIAFVQLGELKDHISEMHDKNLHFRCNLCSRRYLKRYMLNRHQRSVHKFDPRQSVPRDILKVERKYKCFCGLAFPYKSRLLKHQEKHDEIMNSKMFKCPVADCVHSFKARSNLIRHQKDKGHIKHEECYKYTCKCGIQFNSLRGFSNHKLRMKCARKKAFVPPKP